MPHLDEGILHALVDGEIPSAELAPIREHLASCAECRSRLEEARVLARDALALIEAVDLPPGTPVDVPVRPRRGIPFRHIAWAASVLLAAGLGYVGGRGREEVLPTGPGRTPDPPAAVAATEHDTAVDEGATLPSAPPPAPPATHESRPATTAATSPENTTGEARKAAAPTARAAPAVERRLRDDAALDEAVVAGRAAQRTEPLAMAAEAPAPLPFEEVSLPDAVRLLGGTLRLIDGMVPERLVAAGPVVRVIYPAEEGSIVLEQERRGGVIVVTLTAPPSVAPDSLAVLRGRIR